MRFGCSDDLMVKNLSAVSDMEDMKSLHQRGKQFEETIPLKRT